MNTKFKIIPAIDILDGKCVRLTQGNYTTQVIYNEDPLEVAKTFEGAGIQYVHIVDLDGARSKRIVNYKTLEKIANSTNLNIDFGGGVKSDSDIKIAFESGAHQITCGSIAVTNPQQVDLWLSEYSSDKIILGADCRNRKIAINGWQKSSQLDVIAHIKKYEKLGIKTTICTDIQKDGLLQGPSIALYKEILSQSKINLIASGGISSIEDIIATRSIGCSGVIIGKAIYENKITLNQLTALC